MYKVSFIIITIIAKPLRSDDALAAVADVLGTLSVAVSMICILSGLTFNALLATWRKIVKLAFNFNYDKLFQLQLLASFVNQDYLII